jgi:aryl-alcohol dehydrogenase-like predicted oxidoreductase
MNYCRLGKSELFISRIGFGCMSLGEDDAHNARLIQHAIANGINFFDTANLYQKGFNELSVGKALKEKRKEVIIATKGGNQWRPDGSGWDWNPRKEYILAAAEKSLQRLQTDYIDLYQLHGGTTEDPIDETIDAFETLQHQGKIRYYGISSIRPNVIREYVKRSQITSVMMQYSLLDRRPEENCFDLLLQNNIGVLARGALAKGLLVNKAPETFLDYSAVEVKKAQDVIASFSGTNRSAAATALQFTLHHAAISSAIIGIRTMEQLNDVLATIHTPLLNEKELEKLKQILPVNFYNQHR